MVITKQHIVRHLQKKIGISEQLCSDFTSSLFQEIINITSKYGNITINNFGNFKETIVKPRKYYNIQSKSLVLSQPKKILKFYPSVKLKKNINKII